MKRIYMDNAATTRVTEPVLTKMLPYLTEQYGNPMSVHAFGRAARRAVDEARSQVAKALNAQPSEIFFTGCGTESDNWAVRGTAYALKSKGNHIITTSIEHHALLHTCAQLEKEGFRVTYLPVDEYGKISLNDLKNAMTGDTILVSVMMANNEIGTIQPVEEIGALCREKGVRFHTDAVQAVGAIPVDVKKIGCDLLSLSGHKFHAPKGVGALYVKTGTRLQRLMQGGDQEKSQRPGTENTAGIVGLGEAIELAAAAIPEKMARLTPLRDHMIHEILTRVPESRLNGHPTDRLPGNVNVSIRFIEGESLLLSLDLVGVAASSGSACTSGSLDPSHVLLAIGLPHETAHGSLRFCLGDDTTLEDVDYAVDKLVEIVRRLRSLSPLTPDALKDGTRVDGTLFTA